MQCQAKAKSTGEQCQRSAVNGRRVCTVHGGLTPRGLANPNTIHGLYSKDLPTRLATSYQDLLQLGDKLWQIADETAAITALTQQALSGIDNGESGAAWRRIAVLHQQMEAIQRKSNQTEEDLTAFAIAFDEIGQISRHKSMSYAARDEAARLMEVKRKFVGDERKARTEAAKVMTFDRVMLILTAIVAGIKQSLDKHTDTDTKNKILADSQVILGQVLDER